jgi:hypothetical protein
MSGDPFDVPRHGPTQIGDEVTILSGRYRWRRGIFGGWTSHGGEPRCAEIDLLPEGRAKARHVRVTTIGHATPSSVGVGHGN